MKQLVEPLILYAVLFLPDPLAFSGLSGDAASFSAVSEMGRFLGYSVPALLLLWYLIFFRGNGAGAAGAPKEFPRPGPGDIQSFFLALPGLLGLGLLVSLVSPLLFPAGEEWAVESPGTAAGWAAVLVSSLGTGYLEEGYFRQYLLSRFDFPGFPGIAAVCASSALFALCHLYEGPGGLCNAFLAGLLLALVYRRFRSLHGLAWAHGIYNVLVYATGM